MKKLAFCLVSLTYLTLTTVAFSEPAASVATQPTSIGSPHICGARWYPTSSIKRGAEGLIVVRFTVDTNGKVVNPEVARSSGDADLDAAALECVSGFLYQPATQDGHSVETKWDAGVVFCLDPQCMEKFSKVGSLLDYLDEKKYPAVR